MTRELAPSFPERTRITSRQAFATGRARGPEASSSPRRGGRACTGTRSARRGSRRQPMPFATVFMNGESIGAPAPCARTSVRAARAGPSKRNRSTYNRSVANKYLSYDDQRAPKVRAMFSRLAARYDVVNDVMSLGLHRRWKRDTIRLALEGRTGPVRVLDLCCGTGDLSFLAEANARPGFARHGPRLHAAHARRRGAAPVRAGSRSAFAQGDATRLPFPDGAFDVVTVGYGLRNIADPLAALREMRRVLAPRGRVVVLDFGKPDSRAAGALYQAFLRTVMPRRGLALPRRSRDLPLHPGVARALPGPARRAGAHAEAGLDGARYESRLLGTMGLNVGEAPPRSRPYNPSCRTRWPGDGPRTRAGAGAAGETPLAGGALDRDPRLSLPDRHRRPRGRSAPPD